MSTNTSTRELQARQAADAADYKRLGIEKGRVQSWEDGARTDGTPGSYEWWYVDAHLDDGATIVAVFMSKHFSTPEKPLAPMVRLNLEVPGQKPVSAVVTLPPEEWEADKDGLDVRIGGNYITGDQNSLTVHARIENIEVTLTVVPLIPSWRPETGHMYFGSGTERLFGWLPAIPQGSVTATYRIGKDLREAHGTAYHDHNWGNVSLSSVVNDWYWARGLAGPYTTIASFITASGKYSYDTIPIFMLARDGKIIADDSSRIVFETADVYIDDFTGKPVAGTTTYRYIDGAEEYRVSFVRARDLLRRLMIDNLDGKGLKKALAAGFDGAYLRFAGSLLIEHRRNGVLLESHRDESAIWELMYFGHARGLSE